MYANCQLVLLVSFFLYLDQCILCNVDVNHLHMNRKFIQIPDIYHAVLKISINLFLVVLVHNFQVTFLHLFQFIFEF